MMVDKGRLYVAGGVEITENLKGRVKSCYIFYSFSTSR